MIYIVSGYMRSGTSMMMDCLRAGGLDVAFNESRDKMNTTYGDAEYKPNLNGLYELTQEEYSRPNFPDHYEGKAIKCLRNGLVLLKARNVSDPYKVIFMKRDFVEIQHSLEAFFDYLPPINVIENTVNRALGIALQRRDMDVTIINYRDVIDNPLIQFQLLQSKGIPIDIDAAVSVVDTALCRFKRESI